MNKSTLTKLVKMADAHREADEYMAGHYEWQGGGACAIGCTIRDAKKIGLVPKSVKCGAHAALAACNGVPELAWRLCDHIFESLPDNERVKWPPRFLRAIRPDADYTALPARVMSRCARKLAADALTPEIKATAETLAGLWDRRAKGDDPPESEWAAVRQQADAAGQQADAAWRQADAARQQADAARQQAYAARRQADAAWRQAYAARQQADAARADYWRWLADVVCEELGRPEPRRRKRK